MRSVSVLEVADPSVWDELAARAPLEPHVAEELGPLRRIVKPSFEKDVLPRLAEQGAPVLVRYARRGRAEVESAAAELAAVIAGLPADARRVLTAARHHAVDGVVRGLHAWDPVSDAASVRVLRGAGLLEEIPDDGHPPFHGSYRLNPDLPPAEPFAYDLADAAMDETDDLEDARPGPVGLLHDLAALAAAIEHVGASRTVAGAIAKADGKRLAARLGKPDAVIDSDPRWGRALRGLDALRVVSTDPLTRVVHLDHGLETTLAGDTPDAVDALIRRMVEADLQGVLPAVRAALRAAGDGAVDLVVFLELVREQHRDVLFPAWKRGGERVYPTPDGASPRPYDDDGFEAIETPMVYALLGKLARLGLVRRAPGVFAGTADGRVWARIPVVHPPPVWISSDLEVMVPPDAITPWERFQLERLSRCLSRDVVDRYRLERKSLDAWLATHEVDEALELLRRRAKAVPTTVEDTLRSWARSAMRVVLTRGVIVEG
jgi:hypothetical protein